jgi:hypothetical protein
MAFNSLLTLSAKLRTYTPDVNPHLSNSKILACRNLPVSSSHPLRSRSNGKTIVCLRRLTLGRREESFVTKSTRIRRMSSSLFRVRMSFLCLKPCRPRLSGDPPRLAGRGWVARNVPQRGVESVRKHAPVSHPLLLFRRHDLTPMKYNLVM